MYKLCYSFFRKMNLRLILLLIHPNSALIKIGWFKSFREKSVVDKNDNPIPWWTYSFIDFIEKKLIEVTKKLDLNYNSGNFESFCIITAVLTTSKFS